MGIHYPARITAQDDGGFLVQFVDLQDTFTEGATLEEALFNASEVLSAMLSWHLDEGHALAAPTAGLEDVQVHCVTPDAKTQAALLLRTAGGERPISDVARALETSWPAAKRLEDATHWPSLKPLPEKRKQLSKFSISEKITPHCSGFLISTSAFNKSQLQHQA